MTAGESRWCRHVQYGRPTRVVLDQLSGVAGVWLVKPTEPWDADAVWAVAAGDLYETRAACDAVLRPAKEIPAAAEPKAQQMEMFA